LAKHFAQNIFYTKLYKK